MSIRLETSADVIQIGTVHLASFPTADEAKLVDDLRAKDAIYSLVATQQDTVIGHCSFSRMTSPTNTLDLGPVAVLPEFREQGVANRMIRAGLNLAIQDEWTAVFVLGNPQYYQRFGFDPKIAERVSSPYGDPAFMALTINAAEFNRLSGPAQYPSAFDRL